MDSEYPPTRIESVVEELHGVTIEDPYRWLEDTSDQEVQDWIKKQNAFTSTKLGTYAGMDKIRNRLLSLFNHDVILQNSFKVRKSSKGTRFFYLYRKAGSAQPVLYYQDGEDAERIELIDPMKLSSEGLVAIDWYTPSPDGSLIAYGISRDGTEKSVLHIIRVETAETLTEQIPGTRYSSIAWLHDCSGFYYTRYPIPGTVPPEEEGYNRHVFFHKIGQDYNDDVKVFGEGRAPNELALLDINRDSSILSIMCHRFIESDVFVAQINPSDYTDLSFSLVIEGNHTLSLPQLTEDTLYVLTQEDAPNGQIISYDMRNFFDDKSTRQRTVIVKEGTGVISFDNVFSLFHDKIVVVEDENASSKLKLYDCKTGVLLDTITFDTLVTVQSLTSAHDIERFYFSIESYFLPPSISYYETSEIRGTFFKPTLDLDETQFKTEQVWYTSKDGTKISMFLLSKTDFTPTERTPVNLTGYGGFGISKTPQFSPNYVAWVENNGVVAIPNLRGGGEYGQKWHRAGNRENKQNVYDDFISAGEWLIEHRIGSKDTLGIHGRSNGGLLVGAALTQRPDLFKVVICGVPLLDMVRYTNFLIAKYWIPEYGDPTKEEEFKWLYSYSPYHNIVDGTSYPATYFYTAEGDSRVDLMHALKMAARVQAVTTGSADTQPILLWIETKAGHGVGMPVEKQVESITKFMTFHAYHTGMKIDK
ncbi:MAG: prolyl oligopeptidase family serine peptidase [Candidatus Thorarchaeota archaeon]